VLFHEMVSVIDLETVFDVEVAAVGDVPRTTCRLH
jgi:hypothetical protein